MTDPAATARDVLVAELTQLLQEQAAGALRDIAERLVDAPPAKLFGQTEFAIRDILLDLGAKASSAHRAQKKTATTAAAFPVPTPTALTRPAAAPRPASTTTASDAPSGSSARSSAAAPTTTAAAAVPASPRGTSRSGSRRRT